MNANNTSINQSINQSINALSHNKTIWLARAPFLRLCVGTLGTPELSLWHDEGKNA
jgi:hypothetical protein